MLQTTVSNIGVSLEVSMLCDVHEDGEEENSVAEIDPVHIADEKT